MLSQSPEGRADHEKLSWPVASGATRAFLVPQGPGWQSGSITLPEAGDGAWEENGWEVRGSAKPSRLWETEETGQAWLRGKGRRAPHSRGLSGQSLLPAGSGSALGVRDFSPTPSRPRRPLSVMRRSTAASAKKKVKVAAPEVGRKTVPGSGLPATPARPSAAAPAPGHGNPGRSCPAVPGAFPALPSAEHGHRDPHSPAGSASSAEESGAMRGAGTGPGGRDWAWKAGTGPGGAERGAEDRPCSVQQPRHWSCGVLLLWQKETEALFLICSRPHQPDLNTGWAASGTHP